MDELYDISKAQVRSDPMAVDELSESSGKRNTSAGELPRTEAIQAYEAAKLELEHRVGLYQFHVGSYIRGIAFFLAINAVLFKFAIDDSVQRRLFSTLALLCGLAILIPLFFSFQHLKDMGGDFKRLADATGTKPIAVTPLAMLAKATACFWVIIFGAWTYMFFTT